MSGRTAYDSLPELVRFDRAMTALSASTVDQILSAIASERHVQRHIVRSNLLTNQLHLLDEAWSHVIGELCEMSRSKADKFLALFQTKGHYRYFVTGLCKRQFRSVTSSWSRTWSREAIHDDVTESVEPVTDVSDLDSLRQMALPDVQYEQEWTSFIRNLEELFKDIEWYFTRLWAIYNLDVHGWLKEDPSRRMSFRLIRDKTGIPCSTGKAAVAYVNAYIREHYESRFGVPVPMHLIDDLFKR